MSRLSIPSPFWRALLVLTTLGTGALRCTFDFDESRYTYAGDDVASDVPDSGREVGEDVPPDGTDGVSPACTSDEDCADLPALAACRAWRCAPSGQCEEMREPDDTSCDDGDPCTVDDACEVGVCVSGEPRDCRDVVDCTKDRCDAITGDCLHEADDSACVGDGPCVEARCEPAYGCVPVDAPDDQRCDDGDACTTDDICRTGLCVGEDVICAQDDNPCTVARCDAEAGCQDDPVTNGETCNDADPCTDGDHCESGRCVGSWSRELCDCETDGDCAHLEDGDLCNGTLHCADHACVVDESTIPVCPPPDPASCLLAVCLPDTGTCDTQAAAFETLCDDGDTSTVADHCSASGCVGWRKRTWQDTGRATQLDGVSATGGDFVSIGASQGNDGAVSAFILEVDVGSEEVRVPDSARHADGRRYTRIDGTVAVDDSGAVTRKGVTGWMSEDALATALEPLEPRDELRGAWWTRHDTAVAPSQASLWLAGAGSDEATGTPHPWLARCGVTNDRIGTVVGWTCTGAVDSTLLQAGHRLDAVVAFANETPRAVVASSHVAAEDPTRPPDRALHALYAARAAPPDGEWERVAEVPAPWGSVWRDLHASGTDDVWVVGSHGLLWHYDGTTWAAVDAGLADPEAWSLNGVWSAGGRVFVAATWRGRLDNRADSPEVLQLVVLSGRIAGATATSLTWAHQILASREICAAGEVCPPAMAESAALSDVWGAVLLADDGVEGALHLCAVGYETGTDGGVRHAVSYTLVP